MARPPSGRQFEIAAAGHRATIVEVGGGIRELERDGRPILDPYPVDRICDGAHGAPLIPWPNRLANGRYEFDGEDFELPLTEPGKRNAIHGLMRWRPWTAAEHEAARVVMAARLHPQPGYPFELDLKIAYELGEEGLTVTTTARNLGERPCPFGHGQHPYLSPGAGLVDACALRVDAETRVLTDPERQLPTGREPVAGTELDFRAARRLGDLRVDDPFTDLIRDVDRRARIRLTGPDDVTAELWVDEGYRFLEVYSGDTLHPDRARRGLGAEPMTCGPNAFATGEDVVAIDPGESFSASWGARLS
jgi:aldose 1-epimerase